MIQNNRATAVLTVRLLGIASIAALAACTQPNFGGPARTDASLIQRTQYLLNDDGYDAGPADGVYGERTRSAVLAYQQDHRMRQDGVLTWSLVSSIQGDIGLSTQTKLADLGYYHGPQDGVIGEGTRTAIRDFESAKGMEVDGRITPALRLALNDADTASARVAANTAPPSGTAGSSQPPSTRDGRFAPGDHVSVLIADPGSTDMKPSDLVVGRDGRLSLPDGGSVHAEGLRSGELENAIAAEYARHYQKNMSVSVSPE